MFRPPLSSVLAACAITVLASCSAPSIIRVEGKLVADDVTPECPHTWALRGLAASAGGFATDVPEFNDCQKLLVPAGDGRFEYGPLAAVFARERLEQIADSTLKNAPTAVALVYLPQGGAYRPLRIESTFSCLVLGSLPTGMQAWMVPMAVTTPCGETVDPAALAAAPTLSVHVVPPGPKLVASDVPAVARWDWDDESRTQYIGIRCGSAWCEVGQRPAFASSKRYAAADDAAPLDRRRLEVKGWYDEQRLAEFPGALPVPGAMTATVVPTTRLQELHGMDMVNGQWEPVATIYANPSAGSYEKSFGFIGDARPLEAARSSTLSICRGSSESCEGPGTARLDPAACADGLNPGERWYARVDHPALPPRYFCVIFRRHPPSFHVPAVVRWRWRENDETIWVSCPNGCCEVNAKRK